LTLFELAQRFFGKIRRQKTKINEKIRFENFKK